MVVGLTLAVTQDAIQAEASDPAPEAALPAPEKELPPGRVGRVSLVSGNADVRTSRETGWADAVLNQPVFTGEALRTDLRARAEIQIGANTIDMPASTEIEITSLNDQFNQLALSRGRIYLHLRPVGDGETVEIDTPQGGLWLLGPGRYDVDAGDGDRPPQIAVFQGTAQFVGSGGDTLIEAGQTAVLTVSDNEAASTEPTTADDFVEWCKGRDYDETPLVAPYHIAKYMTGFAELDAAGIWKINANYGPVWFPTDQEWSPYRFGHWSWMAPWGWTWIDDRPWGFAPSHYGRWAMIDEHWAWVPGDFVAHPLFAPAVVAFLGTPGIGLSSEDGAAVAWFPLAPGEEYWPTYTRDVGYVKSLNVGNVRNVDVIGMQADGEPPLEVFHKDFANRQLASVVPRSVFVNGRPIAPARMTLPEQRLRNAPVLMGSPQIAPPSTQQVAHAAVPAVKAPSTRVVIGAPRKGTAKIIRAASIKPRGHEPPVVIRGAHLHVPSYAGQAHGRQTTVVRVAYSPRVGAGKGARH